MFELYNPVHHEDGRRVFFLRMNSVSNRNAWYILSKFIEVVES